MNDIHFEPEPGSSTAAPPMHVPRGALIMAGALIVTVFAIAISARVFGTGAFRERTAPEVQSRQLRFFDEPTGGVRVVDATTGVVASEIAPGTNGFLRGALRTLTHARRVAGIDATPPFRLVRYADGRLVLVDPATSQRVTISSFGPTQVESFDRLLR